MIREWTQTAKSLFFVGALVLAGCATQQQIPTEDSWRVTGKFSLSDGEHRESGNFDWRQNGSNYQVRLFGPLGFGAVHISGDENIVSIRSSRDERQSSDPDTLLYEMTGMYIPITEIPDWLAGKPATFHSENTVLDQNGNVSMAFIHGWQVSYADYSSETQLPGQMVATQGDAELKLVALNWQ